MLKASFGSIVPTEDLENSYFIKISPFSFFKANESWNTGVNKLVESCII